MGRQTDKQHEQGFGPGALTPFDAAEAALVEDARALREEAWREIYQRHAQQVYAYIFYRLGDPHTADDLTADVFAKAIGGIKSYSYRGTPLLAWLYRIAHNVTADHRKSAAKRAQHVSADDPGEVEARRNELQELDDRSDMLGAIRSLTDDQQQVIILRFYHGMTSAEVSRVMGKPEGAVKQMQTRAVRALRRVLTQERLQAWETA